MIASSSLSLDLLYVACVSSPYGEGVSFTFDQAPAVAVSILISEFLLTSIAQSFLDSSASTNLPSWSCGVKTSAADRSILSQVFLSIWICISTMYQLCSQISFQAVLLYLSKFLSASWYLNSKSCYHRRALA